MKTSRAHAAMGGKKSGKRTGRKVRGMYVKPGKSGGYVVKHDLEPQSKEDAMNAMMGGQDSPNTEEHAVPDLASMQAHLAQHLPEQNGEEDGQQEPDGDEGQGM
jgi:hypothetical protein